MLGETTPRTNDTVILCMPQCVPAVNDYEMNDHILIAGYYGFYNSGDEAILRVLLSDLRRVDPDLSICILSGDPESTQRCFGVEAIAHEDVIGIIEQARRSNALVIGGGGIFQDYWGAQKNTLLTSQQAGLPFYSTLPLLGCLLNKPVLIYAVGVGPFFSTEAKELTRLSFKSATISTVRDADSLELLHSIGVMDKKIQVTADPAFILQADAIRAREILNKLPIDPNCPIVGVCLRNWDIGIEPSIWQAATATGLDEFANRIGCSFIFLPLQDLSTSPLTQDSFAADAVIQQMKHQQNCVRVPFQEDPAVTAGILSLCSMVVGMRYHSIVYAACSGVPPVALAYDSKVSKLMDSLGLGEATLRLSDISGAALVSTLIRVWENRPHYQKQLAGKIALLKRSAEENFHAIQKLLAIGSARSSRGGDVDDFIYEFALQKSISSVEQKIRGDNLWTQLYQQEQASNELVSQIQEKNQVIHVFSHQIADQKKELQVLDRHVETLTTQLNDLYHSRAWKLILILWNVRKWIIPRGSWLEGALRSAWHKLRNKPFLKASNTFQPPFPFNDRYIVEDNSQVTLYTDDPLLFPGYPARNPLSNTIRDGLKVSLIASVKDEAGNVLKWTECINKQSRLPDEIVILDGGSIDGTDTLLEDWGYREHVRVKVIRAPGTNIPHGRNIAIRESRYPIIAITDFGCEPKPDWLEKLIQPFSLEPETRVSAGFYESISRSGKVLSGNGIWPGLEQLDPQSFLPSSRSVAFQKEALDEVGGHPEWLTRTGDDTYLDLELKRLGGKWAFVPQAQVKWLAPEKLSAYLDKMYQWASGDGESGVHARYYWRYVQQLGNWLVFSSLLAAILVGVLIWKPAPTLLWAGLCCFAWLSALVSLSLKVKLPPQRLIQKGLGHAAQVLGFLRGARNRKEVDRRRISELTGVFFILSGVPLDDSGGGARGTQIAKELLRAGWGVVFLHKFERDETLDLQLRNLHPNVFLSPIDRFNLEKFIGKHPNLLDKNPIRVLIEFPLPDYLSLAKQLRDDYDATVVYDLLDDWKTSLGGKWYFPEIEEQIIQLSTHLVATVPGLADWLENVSKREVLILPKRGECQSVQPESGIPPPH